MAKTVKIECPASELQELMVDAKDTDSDTNMTCEEEGLLETTPGDGEAVGDPKHDGQDRPAYTKHTPNPPNWKDLFMAVCSTFPCLAGKLSRAVRVSLPCVGIDGCTRALQGMSVSFQPLNVYDLEEGYLDSLQKHYAEVGATCTKINLGAEAGAAQKKHK